MPVATGTRLGAYEVGALIGVGGMGEVYRGRDTKLNRDVALKVLPDAFVLDPDRLARFKREAQLLASLSHPNIAGIFGFEDTAGVHALALELVEGPTLADRLERSGTHPLHHDRGRPSGRALPFDEALAIARQVAEALEAAHEQSVIHRDLKPANIKVRADGVVKVLDFGLAKALNAESGGRSEPSGPGGLTVSPTITSPAMTQMGVILGTAAYMSPEQAKGRPADKRSDIWAFGCVLFEMLTGARAFEGEDISETLAAVLKSEPDWEALPAETPGPIRALLRRCLEKDRRRRVGDIAAALFAIDEASNAPTIRSPERGAPRPPLRAWLPFGVMAILAAVAVVVAVFGYFSRTVPDAPTMRFAVALPDGWRLSTGGGTRPLALSPDGRRLVFEAFRQRNAQLWLRSLDSLTPQPLSGTEGGTSPFWSPDGRFIGFFADGKLKRVDVSGGTPTTATKLAPDEAAHSGPQFLPDGKHFFYRALLREAVATGATDLLTARQYVGSLDAPDRPLLLDAHWPNVVFVHGHVLFPRETTLMAQPFDIRRLALTGEPVPVVERLLIRGPRTGLFSASQTGVLAYATTGTSGGAELTWFDRRGAKVGVLGERADYAEFALSPDGMYAAVRILNQQRGDVWIVDVARGVRIPL